MVTVRPRGRFGASRLPLLGTWWLCLLGVQQASVHCFRCSMNTEDGAKLYDVCPHVSDSVCELYQASFSRWRFPSLAPLAAEAGGLLSRELGADLGQAEWIPGKRASECLEVWAWAENCICL